MDTGRPARGRTRSGGDGRTRSYAVGVDTEDVEKVSLKVSSEEVSGNEPAVSRVCKRIRVPRDKSRGTRVCASPPFGRADRDGRVVGRVVVS
jgi:predicted RNA methylase